MDALKHEDGESLNLIEENIEALKAIFPDAFSEDGINFDTLRQLLGDQVADGEEKYGLSWHGKKKARQIALTPSTGTLRPCPEESVDWDTTQNLFIEGDNLEVLKLLQKSYAGKIKMIYIDPPYNTGKEFVYPDNYQDNLDTYLRYTGQVDDAGLKFSSNKESSGRKHTNWLNMMLPRLKLARNLLRDDGIIVVSIDENENANLVKLLDDVFGEENFCGEIIWKNSSKNDQMYVSMQHEYFVVFTKNKDANGGEWVEKKAGLDEIYKAFEGFRREHGDDWEAIHKAALEFYKSFPDSNPIRDSKHYSWMDERGVYFPDNISGPNDGQYVYDVRHPVTGEVCKMPSTGWRYPEETLLQRIKEKRVHFGADHTTVPNNKTYLKDTEQQSLTSMRFVDGRSASKRLQKLFGDKLFTNPKDEFLLKDLFKAFGVKSDDVVLDFFAGSASTLHAVSLLNLELGSSCRAIMVQLPEDLHAMEKAASGTAKKTCKNAIGYLTKKGLPANICEIGKERARLVKASIEAENSDYKGDLGFKVFKLDSSNIRAWNPDMADLEQSLLDHAEHLEEGRSEKDVLYELLLKRGVDLTVPIEEKSIVGKTVYSIGFGVLFACLDEKIANNEIEPLARDISAWHKELEPASDTQVVFRDSAFADDIAKTNMTAILEQNGIAHVRSL
ncbi:adenine-specific DNA-methyltransferase [Rhodovulum bhavnagarense]|uniref:site-specific DNA-methyltransferase (adenine-specific) n=2 Tax=Rhodovulum bhavnagarense TaxID=992286 RepID=A0A4R2RF11_9RHOB|nr:adenine-specific DNA-methyltransferase [Rhodovulum bhavnagarense]